MCRMPSRNAPQAADSSVYTELGTHHALIKALQTDAMRPPPLRPGNLIGTLKLGSHLSGCASQGLCDKPRPSTWPNISFQPVSMQLILLSFLGDKSKATVLLMRN